MGVSSFLAIGPDVHRRLTLATSGVRASIAAAHPNRPPPADWTRRDGVERAVFRVRVQSVQGTEFSSDLYLRRDVVEALARGEAREIVFAAGNPRMFRMADEDPNAIPLVWPALGCVLLGVFVYSLRIG